MSKLTQKIAELSKKENIQEITIASSEGLPITSNAADFEKESAEGVDEVQQRLLKSGMKYLNVVDGKGMKVLYYDGKFYYIVRAQRLVSDKTIAKFRQLVDSELEEREKESERREAELKRIKEERERREAELKRIKEERERREAEVKKLKEKREQITNEVQKIKEAREKNLST